MPKANKVAMELRKVADALDLHPDVTVAKPILTFYHFSSREDKDTFLATARMLPRPVAKVYPPPSEVYGRVEVKHDTDALIVSVSIYRNSICRIIKPAQPAEYDCELTLLDDEEASLAEA